MKLHRRFAPAGLRVLAFSAAIAVSACISPDAHAQAPDASASAQAAPPARITQAIDEKNLVLLKGNVHPLARSDYDQGAVGDGLQLHRMLLLLQRSPDQETALEKLLDDQQDKSSPNYHAWLTPQQFGQQFGPAEADIQTVTTWLQSHGFQVTNVTAGRTLIEFSGTAGQVRSAFHTEIHNYLVNGESHTANATNPQIPAALAPVVVGPVSLNNFPISSHLRQLGTFHRNKGTTLAQPLDKPLYTFPGCTPAGCFALGPADFATIYNSAPLLSGTPRIDGTGQTIAIVGESDIDPTDVTDFQTMFGMTPNFSAANNIIVNGADPGKNGSESESDLDVQWASAVAPGATIEFVTSQTTETTAGIFLSATYIVENNLAGVMSESFGGCEQLIGTLNQFHNSLWQQAAAQGVTVILSAGDGGSAGCDNFDTQQTATHGLAVSGFASTPYNIAVGGTDFDEINRWSQFWSNTNTSPSQSSALSYIPEIPWNDSCAQLGISGCGASAPNGSLNIVAGSGGVSALYAKPSWQSGAGVPTDRHRDLPDVSLFASNGFDGTFYIICQKDVTGTASCNLGSPFFTFQGIGGTSASAPAFAGIMALVNQSQATTTPPNPAPRQGNANYVLYSLFKKQASASPAINCNSSTTPSTSCTFYDVTRGNSALSTGVGTNSVPCTAGSPNCNNQIAGESNGVLVVPGNSSTEAYTVTTGYDLVTGLGSVNIANLAKNWSTVTSLPSTTALSVNGQTAAITGTHGTTVTVSSTVAAGQSGSGTPSGQVALLATPNPTAGSPGPSLGFDVLTLDNTGTATGSGVVLPGGQYNLSAHYQGDGTFGSSDSTPPISVNISAETSKTIISIPVFDPTTGRETGNAPTSLVYGSPYIARIDVGNAQAAISFPPQPLCTPPACPTGTISWTDSLNGAPAVPLDGGTFALNGSGYTEDQPIQLQGGMHQLTAGYGGDKSFAASSGNYSLQITPAPTSQQWSPPSSVIVGQPFALQTVIGTGVAGVAPTGTVTFLDGTTPLPGTVTYMAAGQGSNAVLFANTTTTISTGGSHTLTASYSGDANYAASTSSPKTVQALYSTSTAISLSAAEIPFGSSVTATVTVTTNVKGPAITGSILFQTAPGQPATPLSVTTSTDANGNTVLTAMTTITPQGPESLNAGYSGDSNFASSNGSAFIQVDIPDFSLNVSTAPVVINIGQTGTLTFNVTPASNTPSTVALSCSGPPVGYACSIQPAAVNLANSTSSAATITLAPQNSATQAVKSASVTRNRSDRRFVALNNPMAMGGLLAGLSIVILSWPGKKCPRRSTLWFAVVCLMGLFGCGGGSSGGGGPSLFTTTITLTSSAPKSAPFASVTFTATVSGQGKPTGSVTFLSGPDVIGQVAMIDGTASATTAFGNPGIWSITAQYAGDGRNQGSTSPVLNQGVTGNVSSFLQGQTGTLTHVSVFTVTMQ